MPLEVLADQLGEWLNPPVVRDAVIKFAEEFDGPVSSHDVSVGLNLTRHVAHRVLARLYYQGVMSRYKLPMQRRALFGGWYTYQCFVYSFVEETS